MGDFNIDLNKTDSIGLGKLEEFCNNTILQILLKEIHASLKIISLQ